MLVICILLQEHVSQFLKYLESDFLCLGCVHFQLSKYYQIVLQRWWFQFTSFCSVQFSRSVISDSLQPHRLQHTRLLCPSSTTGAYSNSCPLSRWCHPTISCSSPPFNLSQHQGLFQWVSSSHQEAKLLQFQLQYQSFQWIFRTDFL